MRSNEVDQRKSQAENPLPYKPRMQQIATECKNKFSYGDLWRSI